MMQMRGRASREPACLPFAHLGTEKRGVRAAAHCLDVAEAGAQQRH